MHRTFLLISLTAALIMLASCTSTIEVPATQAILTREDTAEPTSTPTAETDAPILTPTPEMQSTATVTPETGEPDPFPLSEPGPYFAGKRMYALEDSTRNGRKIRFEVWYPALAVEDASGRIRWNNAPPDLSQAPYPVVLIGKGSADVLFSTHLVSHGFVQVHIREPEPSEAWDFHLVDHPRDWLFVLDQIGENTLEELEGVINADIAGATGVSGDGRVSLAISGVRIDPDYYLDFCANASTVEPAIPSSHLAHTCDFASEWDAFAEHVGSDVATPEDGLWQPVTDKRIQAVLPIEPEGAWLYGDRGLVYSDIPMLIIVPTEDEVTPYLHETVFIYEHAGGPDIYMVNFVDRGHMMVLDPEVVKRINHFAVAFFGSFLQGREDYAYYFSEEFVTQFEELAWGVYERQ